MNGIILKTHSIWVGFFSTKARFYWYNVYVLFHFNTNSITECFKI